MRLCLLVLLHSTFLSSWSQISRDQLTQYTIEDGLPSNFVYAIAQDDRGFIWVGTDDGLSRYDGYEFRNYTLDDGVPDTEILNFYKDSQGRIWMYTLSGRVGYIQNDSIYTSANKPELAELDMNGQITSICELKGDIYFSSNRESIKIWTGHSIYSFVYPISAGLKQPYLITSKESQVVYDVNNRFGVVTKEGVKEAHPSASHLFGLGHWVEMNDYVIGHPGRTDYLLTYHQKDFTTYTKQLIPGTTILNVVETRGRIFVTSLDGIHEVDTTLNPTFLTPLKNASNVFIDQARNMWLTSVTEGLFFLPKRSIQSNRKLQSVTSLQNVGDTSLHMRHDEVLVSEKRLTGEVRLLFSNSELRGEVMYDIVPLEENVYYLTSKILVSRGKDNYVLRASIKDLSVRGSFFYWPGVPFVRKIRPSDFLEVHNNVDLLYELKEPDIPIERSRKLLWQGDSLWVATDEGLSLWADDSVISLSHTYPLLKSRVWDFTMDETGAIYLATGGNGILVLREDSLIQLTTSHGLLSNIPKKIELRDSVLWVASNRGLNQVVFSGNKNPAVYSIGESEGLPSSIVLDVEFFDDQIYVGTEKGLAYFPASTIFSNQNAFSVFLTRFTADSVTFSTKEHTHLPYDAEVLKMDFAAPSYTKADNITYSYRLQGKHSNGPWIETSERSATFINLKPDQYQFEVRASQQKDDWTSAATVFFTIHPPFWSTTWFIALVIVTGLGIGYGILHRVWRNRRAKHQLAADRVEAQLQALRAQINPHFLFNALNSIKKYLLKNDTEAAEAYLTMYSQHIRDLLHYSQKLTLSLQEETVLLQRYVDIEKIRTGDTFDFEMVVDPRIDPYTTFIPSMIIQPFLENAIWHGMQKIEEKGKISLNLRKDGEELMVEIIDNGKGFNPAESETKESSLGVSLVRERIRLIGVHYESTTNLEIESEPGYGTRILITLPADLV